MALFMALLPALDCALCHQTSNQTGLINQIGWKRQRKTQKEWGKGEGEPQCATIYCCPPNLPMSGRHSSKTLNIVVAYNNVVPACSFIFWEDKKIECHRRWQEMLSSKFKVVIAVVFYTDVFQCYQIGQLLANWASFEDFGTIFCLGDFSFRTSFQN